MTRAETVRSRRRTVTGCALAAILSLAIAACGDSSDGGASAAGDDSGDATHITAAYGQTSAYNAPMWIAEDEGFFEDNGLDVDLTQLTGARITQGLLTGDVQFVSSSASSTFLARLEGGGPLLVGNLLSRVPWDIVAKDDAIDSVEDLEGKTGAIALRGDFTETALRVALDGVGLGLDDVELVPGFAEDANRVAAVVSGSADFTIVNMDSRGVYEDAGLTRVASMLDIQSQFIMSGIFTTDEWAADNADATTAYVTAMGQALEFMRDNPEESAAVIADYTQQSEDEAAAAYEQYAPVMAESTAIDPDVVEASLRALSGANPAAADADPTEFFDDSYEPAS